jgi:hypothetical protein
VPFVVNVNLAAPDQVIDVSVPLEFLNKSDPDRVNIGVLAVYNSGNSTTKTVLAA